MMCYGFIQRKADFRFYAELNDFLTAPHRFETQVFSFTGTPSVKDAVEAQQVPHTEVDLILVDGESVGFNYRLQGGERVAVYPVFEGLDINPINRLRPASLRQPRFIADVHLGRLARYLRMLGIDVLYRTDYDDDVIVAVSLAEHRTILTRDLGILKTGRVTHGYWVRNTRPMNQLDEVITALQLENNLRPFSRCTLCNEAIIAVSADSVWQQLQDDTRRYYKAFYQCTGCGQVYWKGSHCTRLVERLSLVGGCDRRSLRE